MKFQSKALAAIAETRWQSPDLYRYGLVASRAEQFLRHDTNGVQPGPATKADGQILVKDGRAVRAVPVQPRSERVGGGHIVRPSTDEYHNLIDYKTALFENAQSDPEIQFKLFGRRRRGRTPSIGRAARNLARRIPKAVPYDHNAVDGDGDGLIQEGTIWERPSGTKYIRVPNGSMSLPSAGSLVDVDGKPVSYKPGQGVGGKKPIARAPLGAAVGQGLRRAGASMIERAAQRRERRANRRVRRAERQLGRAGRDRAAARTARNLGEAVDNFDEFIDTHEGDIPDLERERGDEPMHGPLREFWGGFLEGFLGIKDNDKNGSDRDREKARKAAARAAELERKRREAGDEEGNDPDRDREKEFEELLAEWLRKQAEELDPSDPGPQPDDLPGPRPPFDPRKPRPRRPRRPRRPTRPWDPDGEDFPEFVPGSDPPTWIPELDPEWDRPGRPLRPLPRNPRTPQRLEPEPRPRPLRQRAEELELMDTDLDRLEAAMQKAFEDGDEDELARLNEMHSDALAARNEAAAALREDIEDRSGVVTLTRKESEQRAIDDALDRALDDEDPNSRDAGNDLVDAAAEGDTAELAISEFDRAISEVEMQRIELEKFRTGEDFQEDLYIQALAELDEVLADIERGFELGTNDPRLNDPEWRKRWEQQVGRAREVRRKMRRSMGGDDEVEESDAVTDGREAARALEEQLDALLALEIGDDRIIGMNAADMVDANEQMDAIDAHLDMFDRALAQARKDGNTELVGRLEALRERAMAARNEAADFLGHQRRTDRERRDPAPPRGDTDPREDTRREMDEEQAGGFHEEAPYGEQAAEMNDNELLAQRRRLVEADRPENEMMLRAVEREMVARLGELDGNDYVQAIMRLDDRELKAFARRLELDRAASVNESGEPHNPVLASLLEDLYQEIGNRPAAAAAARPPLPVGINEEGHGGEWVIGGLPDARRMLEKLDEARRAAREWLDAHGDDEDFGEEHVRGLLNAAIAAEEAFEDLRDNTNVNEGDVMFDPAPWEAGFSMSEEDIEGMLDQFSVLRRELEDLFNEAGGAGRRDAVDLPPRVPSPDVDARDARDKPVADLTDDELNARVAQLVARDPVGFDSDVGRALAEAQAEQGRRAEAIRERVGDRDDARDRRPSSVRDARQKRLGKEFEGVSDDEIGDEMVAIEGLNIEDDANDRERMKEVYGTEKRMMARLSKLYEELDLREQEQEEAADTDPEAAAALINAGHDWDQAEADEARRLIQTLVPGGIEDLNPNVMDERERLGLQLQDRLNADGVDLGILVRRGAADADQRAAPDSAEAAIDEVHGAARQLDRVLAGEIVGEERRALIDEARATALALRLNADESTVDPRLNDPEWRRRFDEAVGVLEQRLAVVEANFPDAAEFFEADIDGSLPDDRSLRNVRNRFPRHGLPRRAFWRDGDYDPGGVHPDWRDAEVERQVHEQRFGRYFDDEGNRNVRGDLVNAILRGEQPSVLGIGDAQREARRDADAPAIRQFEAGRAFGEQVGEWTTAELLAWVREVDEEGRRDDQSSLRMFDEVPVDRRAVERALLGRFIALQQPGAGPPTPLEEMDDDVLFMLRRRLFKDFNDGRDEWLPGNNGEDMEALFNRLNVEIEGRHGGPEVAGEPDSAEAAIQEIRDIADRINVEGLDEEALREAIQVHADLQAMGDAETRDPRLNDPDWRERYREVVDELGANIEAARAENREMVERIEDEEGRGRLWEGLAADLVSDEVERIVGRVIVANPGERDRVARERVPEIQAWVDGVEGEADERELLEAAREQIRADIASGPPRGVMLAPIQRRLAELDGGDDDEAEEGVERRQDTIDRAVDHPAPRAVEDAIGRVAMANPGERERAAREAVPEIRGFVEVVADAAGERALLERARERIREELPAGSPRGVMLAPIQRRLAELDGGDQGGLPPKAQAADFALDEIRQQIELSLNEGHDIRTIESMVQRFVATVEGTDDEREQLERLNEVIGDAVVVRDGIEHGRLKRSYLKRLNELLNAERDGGDDGEAGRAAREVWGGGPDPRQMGFDALLDELEELQNAVGADVAAGRPINRQQQRRLKMLRDREVVFQDPDIAGQQEIQELRIQDAISVANDAMGRPDVTMGELDDADERLVNLHDALLRRIENRIGEVLAPDVLRQRDQVQATRDLIAIRQERFNAAADVDAGVAEIAEIEAELDGGTGGDVRPVDTYHQLMLDNIEILEQGPDPKKINDYLDAASRVRRIFYAIDAEGFHIVQNLSREDADRLLNAMRRFDAGIPVPDRANWRERDAVGDMRLFRKRLRAMRDLGVFDDGPQRVPDNLGDDDSEQEYIDDIWHRISKDVGGANWPDNWDNVDREAIKEFLQVFSDLVKNGNVNKTRLRQRRERIFELFGHLGGLGEVGRGAGWQDVTAGARAMPDDIEGVRQYDFEDADIRGLVTGVDRLIGNVNRAMRRNRWGNRHHRQGADQAPEMIDGHIANVDRAVAAVDKAWEGRADLSDEDRKKLQSVRTRLRNLKNKKIPEEVIRRDYERADAEKKQQIWKERMVDEKKKAQEVIGENLFLIAELEIGVGLDAEEYAKAIGEAERVRKAIVDLDLVGLRKAGEGDLVQRLENLRDEAKIKGLEARINRNDKANVDFIDKHEAEVEALLDRVINRSGEIGDDEDDEIKRLKEAFDELPVMDGDHEHFDRRRVLGDKIDNMYARRENAIEIKRVQEFVDLAEPRIKEIRERLMAKVDAGEFLDEAEIKELSNMVDFLKAQGDNMPDLPSGFGELEGRKIGVRRDVVGLSLMLQRERFRAGRAAIGAEDLPDVAGNDAPYAAQRVAKENNAGLAPYDGRGIAQIVDVPIGNKGMDAQEQADEYLAKGGNLADVPSMFLAQAFLNNSGGGGRFELIDTGDGVNGMGLYRDGTTGATFGLKFADGISYGENEDLFELTGAKMAAELGLLQGAIRVAGPVGADLTDADGQPVRSIGHAGGHTDAPPLLIELAQNLVGDSAQIRARHQDEWSLADMLRMAALDAIMNNTDRNPKNYMEYQDADGVWRLYPIDMGLADANRPDAWGDMEPVEEVLGKIARGYGGLIPDLANEIASRLRNAGTGPEGDAVRAEAAEVLADIRKRLIAMDVNATGGLLDELRVAVPDDADRVDRGAEDHGMAYLDVRTREFLALSDEEIWKALGVRMSDAPEGVPVEIPTPLAPDSTSPPGPGVPNLLPGQPNPPRSVPPGRFWRDDQIEAHLKAMDMDFLRRMTAGDDDWASELGLRDSAIVGRLGDADREAFERQAKRLVDMEDIFEDHLQRGIGVGEFWLEDFFEERSLGELPRRLVVTEPLEERLKVLSTEQLRALNVNADGAVFDAMGFNVNDLDEDQKDAVRWAAYQLVEQRGNMLGGTRPDQVVRRGFHMTVEGETYQRQQLAANDTVKDRIGDLTPGELVILASRGAEDPEFAALFRTITDFDFDGPDDPHIAAVQNAAREIAFDRGRDAAAQAPMDAGLRQILVRNVGAISRDYMNGVYQRDDAKVKIWDQVQAAGRGAGAEQHEKGRLIAMMDEIADVFGNASPEKRDELMQVVEDRLGVLDPRTSTRRESEIMDASTDDVGGFDAAARARWRDANPDFEDTPPWLA